MIKLSPLRSFPIEEFLLTRLALAPDGASLAVGHKRFRTMNTETGEILAEFAYPQFIGQLRFSPDGRFIAAANVADNHPATPGHLSVFAADTGALHFEYASPLPVETCAFASAGEPLVAWNLAHAHQIGEQPCVVGQIARSQLEPPCPLPSLELRCHQLRALACGPAGYTCFVRESVGEALTVDNAHLVFRKFRLIGLDGKGSVLRDFDLGIGAGVSALSPDGKLLAVEMVDFKNNERHVSLIDTETGVEANLLPLEANTLPVLEFSQDSDFFLCLKEDSEGNFNTLRIWSTATLRLVGEAQLDLSYHAMASCLGHSTLAFLGSGKLDLYAIE